MASSRQHEPVAIVGMGCRWPGGVRNAPDLWEFLINKKDGFREFDKPRFSAKGFYHPNAERPGTVAMRGAFLLDEDARLFDHSFFGITGLELETMDPSQRKLLEVTYEAIENAGETWESVSGSRTGVFVGNFCLDHWIIQSRDWDNPRPYAFVGAGTSILANRISYIFNLQGPSLTVDTACSSSMYALHLAVNAIRAGDCDSAIVASANWIADPSVQTALDKLGALSPSSRCHTFDAKGDGYGRGEGFAALYLKKTSIAVSEGSPIRAMIRGTAMNSNGRTGGITRPSASGQESVIREAYRNAGGLPFGDTSYFEIHGTGTYVGDPIEVSAVGSVFASERAASDPLLVGSVKSNLGHTEGSSALAAIMKVVLAIENGAIPPIFQLETLNSNIDFEKGNVKPVTDLTPWPRDNFRRASINSFGYGGANAHCIIDHVKNVLPDYVKPGIYQIESNGFATNGSSNGYSKGYQNGANGHSNVVGNHENGYKNGLPAYSHHPVVDASKMTKTANASTRQLVLLPFSAHNESSLQLNVDALSQVINQSSLADIAYTLSAKRSKLAQRSFRIVDKADLSQGLRAIRRPARSPLQPSNIGFIFTGQGAAWHAMAPGMFEYRVFRTAIAHLDDVLGALPVPPSWMLRDILCGSCDAELIQTAEVSQTVCTAVQIGLVDLLASWSVRPTGVAGHSSGEMAAAYASGRITAAEAILAAFFRGQAVMKNTRKGAMLAVGLGPEQVSKYLEGWETQVKLAATNSPGSVTLSGEVDAIEKLSAAMDADGVFNRTLKTGGNAYHSHHMSPLGQDYVDMLSNALENINGLGLINKKHRYRLVPWASSVTPSKDLTEMDVLVSYWRANLESPVRFSEAVTNLINLEDNTIHALVEIGPHPALKNPVEQIIKNTGKSVAYTSTLKRQQDSRESMLQLAGTLFGLNADVNLVAVNAVDEVHGTSLEHGCTCIDLPPYQYTYGELNYHESRASKDYRFRQVPRHDLLGSKVVGTAKLRPQWRNIIRLKDLPWLGDHRLLPDAILPAAGYITMAIEAASRIYHEFPAPSRITGYSLRDLAIMTSLRIPEDDYGVEVLTTMELVDTTTVGSSAWATFSISSVSRDSEEWLEHCTGLVKIDVYGAENVEKMSMAGNSLRIVDSRAWYKKFAAIGLGYGPAFQPLSNIRADPDMNIATARVSMNTTAEMIKGGESSYAMHPASLDGTIQLGLIACHGGQVDLASTAFVPVQLSRLYLKNGINEGSYTAVAKGETRGARGAYLDLQMMSENGEIVLHVDNIRCVSYSSESKVVDRTFSSPFTRLVWRPDFRSLSNRQCRKMFPPPKENVERSPLWGITNTLAYMIVYDIYETFGKSEDGLNPSGDVGHFLSWIKRRGEKDDSEEMKVARKLSRHARLQRIEELVQQAPDVIEVKVARLLHENMADILHERRTGIDVILGEGLLTPLYQTGLLMTGIYPQLLNVLEHLAHVNPNLRIVEIGGGTGGATRVAMRAFSGPNAIKSYKDYTFTDISPGFLSGARESMSEFGDMSYSVLDAEVDPSEQGYEPVYDLVIACQVLHATSNMHKTLSNVGKLLKPGGKLVLVETTQNFMVPGVVVGTFTGYWSGIPDGRVDAPFMSLESWDSALKSAGFSGTDITLDDFPHPNNTTSVILSTFVGSVGATQDGENRETSAEVQLLYSTEASPQLVGQLAREIERRGGNTRESPLVEALDRALPDSRVIALIDEEHLLLNSDKRYLETFQHLARNATSMVVITSCGIVNGRNPEGALIPGLLRVLGTENPGTQFLSIDIDAVNFEVSRDHAENLVRCIVDNEFSLQHNLSSGYSNVQESTPRDRELVWQDGAMWVSRLVPDASSHSLSSEITTELLPLDCQGTVRAAFETPGLPNSMYFKIDKEMWQPIPPVYIDVKITAIGLTAQDVDVWLGRADSHHLSSEYAGVVTAVGAEVGDFKIGDRVFGVGKGQFGNSTRVPAAFAHKLQPEDDMVQMATMPIAYMTAIYVFDHVVRLKKGQKVLIQSATSDLGLAATRLAQAKGAEVFATVDTPDKARLLVEKLSIPSSHVFSSQNPIELQRVAFNVILCTVQVGLWNVPLKALKPLGHLVAIGRPDVQDAQTIGEDLIQGSINFSSLHPLFVLELDWILATELLQAVDIYYRQGLIGPIHLFSSTDIGQLSQVLPGFTKDMHIGKLVVTFTKPGTLVKMVTPSLAAHFDHEACYVITGGLGGLGRSMVRWMSDRGAKYLVLISRRSISDVPEAQALVNKMATRGVHVQGIVCDIGDQDQITRVIHEVSSSRPIKGIVHAAVSYLDLSFDKLSFSRWRKSLEAKVQGTKNLHDATLSMPLDFFIMTTSLLSVYALPTQSAYTAANNFQDMFARYRRRLGLPASTASFSLIVDIGDVGLDPITVDAFERNKTLTLSEYQFLALFEPAFMNNKSDAWSGQRQDPLSAANLLTCLDPAAMASKKREEMETIATSTAASPRWYSDARVSLIMRAFSDAQKHTSSDDSQNAAGSSSQSAVVRMRHEFEDSIKTGPSKRTQTVTFVERAIALTVAEMLFIDSEGVEPAKSVADHGVDSLIAAELRNWFVQALGHNISMLDLLDPGTSINNLAGKIVDGALGLKNV
ncbi:hypothetical protein K505DRAFT_356833 [Melanomma pulvis-pyrius CBS 109.77]|uniref:Uncharacterized protein n=1 Tax=Melanomma pulvis-pyrius CBS 109.77 TaxID=1314802 RepID=A0A6A6XSD4_9PLEO|nr:hypothetical protein K505DRAFT_356833 [Melanomma pulvis-pyrius CBS 109.77]